MTIPELFNLLDSFDSIKNINKEEYFMECVKNRVDKQTKTYVEEMSDLERFVISYKYRIKEIIKQL